MRNEAVTEEVELRQESYGVYCIETAVEDFLRYEQGIGRALETVRRHRVALRYWQRYLKEQSINDPAAVTPTMVSGYQGWIYDYRTRFGRPFTLGSQIGILNSLQVFYQYLLKSGKLLVNPVEVIRLPKQPRRLPAVMLTPLEMKRLLAQPDTDTVLGFRDRTMYEVLYSTGLRIGELSRLRVPDLRLAEGLLTVRGGKGQKDRVVPLGETAVRFLKEYLRAIRPLFRNDSGTDRVFSTRNVGPLGKSGVGMKLKLYTLRAGLKKQITVHTFRHTLATEMLKRGADLRQIQELLGHGSLRTTQLYTHIVKGELKRVQAECHPREQTELPECFVAYRGRTYLTDADRRKDARGRTLRRRTGQETDET